jgi:glycosyltransferase involved in cell wall biosynthesis
MGRCNAVAAERRQDSQARPRSELQLAPRATTVAIIHQGFIPMYRTGFHARLAQRRASGIRYVVFHGPAPAYTGHLAASGPFDFPHVWAPTHELRLAGKAALYQPIVRHVMRTCDALVMGAQARFLHNLVLYALFKMAGRPVLLWGQGTDKQEDVGALMSAALGGVSAAKRRLARCADGYIVYTEGGSRRLVEDGVDPSKVFIVRNTLDMREQTALHAELQATDVLDLRASLGLRPDSAVLLYLGRIYKEKRVGELVQAVRKLGERTTTPIEVVVVGDGPEAAAVRAEANGLPNVHFTGEIHDQSLVARYMRVAAAVVIPGKVGLAVNHAFGHGVPVITRESSFHSTELEYVESGVNGLIVPGTLDRFIAELGAFVDSPERQLAMSAAALLARERLRLEFMVEAFDQAVASTVATATRGRRPTQERVLAAR